METYVSYMLSIPGSSQWIFTCGSRKIKSLAEAWPLPVSPARGDTYIRSAYVCVKLEQLLTSVPLVILLTDIFFPSFFFACQTVTPFVKTWVPIFWLFGVTSIAGKKKVSDKICGVLQHPRFVGWPYRASTPLCVASSSQSGPWNARSRRQFCIRVENRFHFFCLTHEKVFSESGATTPGLNQRRIPEEATQYGVCFQRDWLFAKVSIHKLQDWFRVNAREATAGSHP